ncbi:signal peptide peptidase SppA [Modicisalibacter tunisiensis]|uniref:signal peptide peptidase SppA n=1 Tax=Modicisalibacter tunisiensis TaxID=390637 RepID=UPI001CCD9136|nr:signal peptide peptidase SppA [Modicisalibacter tunisiensis]MBZ9537891.1 signal peptide peptidase SppA [Modicisalibacter tunisiensis]
MADERNDDPWTGGEEVPPGDETRREGKEEAGADWRERRQWQQWRLMERWMEGVLVEQRRARRWKLFFRFVFAGLLLALVWAVFSGVRQAGGPTPAGPHVAVVRVEGAIDAEGRASAERIIEGVRQAWRNPDARAVVLDINSPGGSPVQSQRVYAELRRLVAQGGKPVVAVIEDIGASGAYYIASAAGRIYAAPASLVGSIGVIHAGFGLQGAIDKLGVERRVFTAGENKDFLDPFAPVTPEQREFWQQVLDTTHRQFIDAVKAGRGDRLADDPRLFSGLVWTGEQAMSLGLVDELASLEQLDRERFDGLPLEDYTPSLDPFTRLSRQFGRVAAEWLGLPSTRSPVRYQAY